MLMKLRRIKAKASWFLRHHGEIRPGQLTAWIPVSEPFGYRINYNADGLAVQNNCDCLSDDRFVRAYQQSLTVNDWRGRDGAAHDMRWRYYIYVKFAEMALRTEGDFVECGVYKGGYAMAAMDYINFHAQGRLYYLLDTFEGLSAGHLTETEKKAGLLSTYKNYEESYEAVLKTFKNYPTRIIRGTVPETLPECKAEKIAFLSIDMNCTEPEIAALRFFWPKLVSGGIVLHDDYGFAAHIEQKRAVDQLAVELGFSVLSLPTGQAVIIKH
jgi:O-methyltransferase